MKRSFVTNRILILIFSSVFFLLSCKKGPGEGGRASIKGKIFTVSTTEQAIRKIREVASKKSTILVKGSRHTHLERVVNGLLGRSTHLHCYHCGSLK